jgi:ER-bound oxygenase mpaB/B'/Rubber oxygenase, catalytic domain
MPKFRNCTLPARWPSTLRADAWVRGTAKKLRVRVPRFDDRLFASLAQLLVAEDDVTANLIDWLAEEKNGRAQFDAALDYGVETWATPPQPLATFFSAVERRPHWAAPETLARACAVHQRLGLTGAMITGALGLLDGYRNGAVAKTLVMTGSLAEAAKRRIDETSQFLADVYDSQGMIRSSAGFKSTVRVRLVHGYVRRAMRRSPGWREDVFGSPISISDTLATAMQFWVPLVLAAPVFGYRVSTEECEALMTLWNYVAFLQGVPEEALPQSLEGAYRVYCAIWMLGPPANEDSRTLGRAFFAALSERRDLSSRARAKLFHGVAALLIPKQHRAEVGIEDTIVKVWPILLRPIARRRERRRSRDAQFEKTLIARGRAALADDLRSSQRLVTSFHPAEVVHNLALLFGS